MKYMLIARLFVLTFAMLASIGLMGLSANYVNNYTRAHNPGLVKGHLSAWPGLKLGTSIVTFLCATSMLFIDFFRRRAFTSWIVVETAVLGALSILWLATAADATADFDLSILTKLSLPATCTSLGKLLNDIQTEFNSNPAFSGPGASPAFGVQLADIDFGKLDIVTLCTSHKAIEVLAWILFIVFLFYTITLLQQSIVSHKRGNTGVWMSSVRNTNFLAESNPASDNIPMPMTPEKWERFDSESVRGATAVTSQGYNTGTSTPTVALPEVYFKDDRKAPYSG